MKKLLISVFNIFNICFVFQTSTTTAQVKKPVYLNESKPLNQRVEDALRRMTLEEKIAMVHAQSKFSSPGVSRLGIPENWTTDGPHGIRPEVYWDEWSQAKWTNDSCTAFPALTCLAATWDKDLAHLYGKSLGEEARYRNKNILLGPGVNIYRSPLNGRNFEYLGEDPFLASKMVVPYIKGIQQNGVAACVKHFALNNSEGNRNSVNVNVDDRTLYEIYLPAFKAAVQEGGAWAIMGSYNLYKGQHCCHNQYLLNDILRKEWGFKGVVISDWGGVHDTKQAIYNGLDLEFGTGTNGLSNNGNAYDQYFMASAYLKLIRSGKAGTQELDQKVRRILRLSFLTTMNTKRPFGSFATKEHATAARKIAEAGIVLLKNSGNILPVEQNKYKRIAVIGENAIKTLTVGGGSSSLKARYEITPLEGIKKRFEGKAEIMYARGYIGDTSGSYNGVNTGQRLADKRSITEIKSEAIEMAKKADLVIYIGGLNKSNHQDAEGADRKSLDLPYQQNDLIFQLAKENKNLIVVNISGNAISMPWVDQVPAIVQSWYLGSESGNALAAVLAGDVNPSGKLAFTFPVNLADNGAHANGQFPGSKNEVTYSEGIFVGYRWSDKHQIKPLFSFGHGLSYTTFEYSKAQANKNIMSASDKIVISVTVKNIGSREGQEIVQLYISDLKSSLERPVKELKGFEKIKLKPREQKIVTFTIDNKLLNFFNPKNHKWVTEPGDFEALVGTSSSDIKSKIKFTLK